MTKRNLPQIPDSLKFGHKVFPVQFSSTLGKMGNMGYTHTKQSDFLLDPDQDLGELVETVIHECTHIIWKQACLEEKDSEERIVSVISHGLTTLFSRNPDLLKWIQEVQANE